VAAVGYSDCLIDILINQLYFLCYGALDSLSRIEAEAKFKNKQLEEQEKIIHEQRAALRRERKEFDKNKISDTVDLKSLMQILGQIQSDLTQLRTLPE